MTGPTPYLQFELLKEHNVVHGVFSRHGGVSTGPYCSLNVSHNVGDGSGNIRNNRERIKRALGVSRLVSMGQVHGSEVLAVTAFPEEDVEHHGYDAVISNVPDVLFMVQQADCQAVMLYDPACPAIGIIHSGWRGSVLNIIKKTVIAMTEHFSVQPANLIAAVGPSLGPCCAEFVNFASELPEDFFKYQEKPNHFNFWEISREQLLEAGVDPSRIEIGGICSVCDHDYFSYRRNNKTGRFASVIGIISRNIS